MSFSTLEFQILLGKQSQFRLLKFLNGFGVKEKIGFERNGKPCFYCKNFILPLAAEIYVISLCRIVYSQVNYLRTIPVELKSP